MTTPPPHQAAPIRSSQPPAYLRERYRLSRWLGQGSMGLVYLAHDETLGRDVAIKFLLPERIGQQASARFLREARTVAQLSHANIVTLHDVGREGDWHYLVLEHIPGQDLHTLLVERGGSLPVPEALPIARGVLEALGYAHARGVIHRDIKPENIMLTSQNQVKVTDFGLALARGDVRMTQAGAIVGTVLYIAPEVVSGADVDGRADLYALGAVLYEVLTGRPPFSGDSPMAVLAQALSSPLTPPRALQPDIPVALDQIVVRLLAKDPAERYASAEKVLAALPGPAEAAVETVRPPESRSAQARPPLLERIVRSSSAIQADALEEALLVLPEQESAPPQLAQELLVYAAAEDSAGAVEAERRRLASLLQREVIEPLNLLLSQVQVYKGVLAGNSTAHMALSVLTSLVRQSLQQARDLEDNLYPSTLETLGLEPALEILAGQAQRAHGLHISLTMERLPERLPARLELALFRMAQEALERAVRQAHASRMTISLERREEELLFSLADDGLATASSDSLQQALQRLERMGGAVELGTGPQGERQVTIRFALRPPAQLTPRELEVLQLLAEGLSNKEIAQALYVSPRTVNFHLDNIYSKLGVSSRTEAAILALRHGWVRHLPSTC